MSHIKTSQINKIVIGITHIQNLTKIKNIESNN